MTPGPSNEDDPHDNIEGERGAGRRLSIGAWIRENASRSVALLLCLTALYLRPVPTGFLLAGFLTYVLLTAGPFEQDPPNPPGPDQRPPAG